MQISDRRYPHYVLGVLVLVYMFNFIDRNILSILAQDIKVDLGISDSQLGFLYGIEELDADTWVERERSEGRFIRENIIFDHNLLFN